MWIVCNPSRDVGSCWVHCPCTTLGGARAGGNIAEIVYHVANGCVVIIVTQPKAKDRGRERETEKEVDGPTSLGSQLVYARKTYK